MTKIQKERISNALDAYTKRITESSATAKSALESEGIYQSDGKLAPEYREPAAG